MAQRARDAAARSSRCRCSSTRSPTPTSTATATWTRRTSCCSPARRWRGSGTTTRPTRPTARARTPRRCAPPTSRGLPPAVVLTAEYDVLRDEGEAYARRLAQAGVRVEHQRFAGQMHLFFTLLDLVPASAAGLDFVVEAVDRALARHDLDALVVGAGFAGLYTLHRLRELGLDVRVLEAGRRRRRHLVLEPLPGRALRHRVPGLLLLVLRGARAGVGVERALPAQPEILRYLDHVADRFDLRRDIEFARRVVAARYDERSDRWPITTEDGATVLGAVLRHGRRLPVDAASPGHRRARRLRGRVVPHRRAGRTTACDFAGKRVGVIGTGSTGIQLDPAARRAGRAPVRVPAHARTSACPAHNRPLDPDEQRGSRPTTASAGNERASRRRRAGLASRALHQASALAVAPRGAPARLRGGAGQTRRHRRCHARVQRHHHERRGQRHRGRLRARQDPRDRRATRRPREALAPTHHPFGTKRICVDTDYYETFNRDDVTLVDVRRDPIDRITARGVQTAGARYELDVSCSPRASTR